MKGWHSKTLSISVQFGWDICCDLQFDFPKSPPSCNQVSNMFMFETSATSRDKSLLIRTEIASSLHTRFEDPQLARHKKMESKSATKIARNSPV